MPEASRDGYTGTSRIIRAARETLYRAFTDPATLLVWLPPEQVTCQMHALDARVGGYRSSIAASLLQGLGFSSVSEIAGGFAAWEAARLNSRTTPA